MKKKLVAIMTGASMVGMSLLPVAGLAQTTCGDLWIMHSGSRTGLGSRLDHVDPVLSSTSFVTLSTNPVTSIYGDIEVGDGVIYADAGSAIDRFDCVTGDSLASWPMPAGYTYITAMAVGPDGSLYVLSGTSIIKFDANGNVVWNVPPVMPPGYNAWSSGYGVDVDNTYLYVLAGAENPNDPHDGVFVQFYDPGTGAIVDADPFPTVHTHPNGAYYDLDIASDGYIWAGVSYLYVLDPATKTIVWGDQSILAQAGSHGTPDNAGNYWLFDRSSYQKVNMATKVAEYLRPDDGRRINAADAPVVGDSKPKPEPPGKPQAGKLWICHYPDGNVDNVKLLEVSYGGLRGHFKQHPYDVAFDEVTETCPLPFDEATTSSAASAGWTYATLAAVLTFGFAMVIQQRGKKPTA